jgi:hypothetical protein
LPTSIETQHDQDPEFAKVIQVRRDGFTMEHWITTLPEPEQQEWWRQHDIHEAAVHAAVAAGDAEVITPDPHTATIKWRSPEIHAQWMDTISAEDNASYHSFWSRYHAEVARRNQT